jgi:hypothetical protein
MSEINMDFYEDNYRRFDFDGNPNVVHNIWEEIKLVHGDYIRSLVFGIDILTLIDARARNCGPMADTKLMLADMICFFAAGKRGMESRAEAMARAIISGGKLILR